MKKSINLVSDELLPALLKFTVPILLALFLQVAYGAVDLFIVGRFASVSDVSGVTIGSQIMQTIISLCTGLSMGTTILLGQNIGSGESHKAGKTVGVSIAIFTLLAVLVSAILLIFNNDIVTLMKTPIQSFEMTSSYLFICSIGTIFIVSYNVLGSIFRGIGDAKTPLIAVGIACVFNIIGDLILVAGFGMGASGAAIATVAAQSVSVILSLIIIKNKKLPFDFTIKDIGLDMAFVKKIFFLGIPIALQSMLVSFSFLAVTAIVNVMGVIASAGVGVTEKLTGFVMLVPLAFMQSLSAFVAQNYGAGQYERAKKGMLYGMGISFTIGLLMAYFSVFHGEILVGLFSKDPDILVAAVSYLHAYAFDIVFVTILFCMTGYFNGCGKTTFVMIQAVSGALLIRIPLAYFFSTLENTTLFIVGLATPTSTALQIVACVIYYIIFQKTLKRRGSYEYL